MPASSSTPEDIEQRLRTLSDSLDSALHGLALVGWNPDQLWYLLNKINRLLKEIVE